MKGTKRLKSWLSKAISLTVVLGVAFGTVFFVPLKASAATIIIAASNSSSTWKSQAAAVCTGVSDQSTINRYLTTGSIVELAAGTFNCNGSINFTSNSHLYGQGSTTIINLQNANISAIDVNNIELDHFNVTGNISGGGAIFLACYAGSDSGFYVHDIECTSLGGVADFEVYANTYTISNIVFSRCNAINPDGCGFYIGGEGTPSVHNIAFYKCNVQNAGVASTRTTIWATGFDFNEGRPVVTINHLQAINCSVNGSWEAAFYMEDSNSEGTSEQDFVITGCSATNTGQKPGSYMGFGYLIGSYTTTLNDVALYGNTASNNAVGTMLLDGTIYPSMVNGISPVGSAKTAIAVNQGNCGGVIINIDATHKELVLYSTDGNAVNQQIELGNYYAADDGNSYTFNNTKIVAQFTDYTVIRLLKSAVVQPPLSITSSMLPNGNIGVAYSQTLSATGGTTPYTWTIASGTLPKGLSLSSSGVSSGIPTTAGGLTYVTFQVVDSTSASATKAISITILYSVWDVNMDGTVNVLDIILINQHLGETWSPGWIREDVNNDGVINVLDTILVGQHFN